MSSIPSDVTSADQSISDPEGYSILPDVTVTEQCVSVTVTSSDVKVSQSPRSDIIEANWGICITLDHREVEAIGRDSDSLGGSKVTNTVTAVAHVTIPGLPTVDSDSKPAVTLEERTLTSPGSTQENLPQKS